MDARAMVALVVILEDDFPIGRDVVHDTACGPQACQRIPRKTSGERVELLRERAALRSGTLRHQIDEYETAPRLNADWIQRKVFFADAIGFRDIRSGAQAPVEFVRPRVVRAANRVSEIPTRRAIHIAVELRALVENQPAPSMPAHVEVRGEAPVLGAHDKHALTSDVKLEEVAGCGNFFFPRRAEPLMPENALLLAPEDLGREIRFARQRTLERHVAFAVPRHRVLPPAARIGLCT